MREIHLHAPKAHGTEFGGGIVSRGPSSFTYLYGNMLTYHRVEILATRFTTEYPDFVERSNDVRCIVPGTTTCLFVEWVTELHAPETLDCALSRESRDLTD
jgi:hypothetical protein